MEAAGQRPPPQGVEDLPGGGRRSVDDPAHPTIQDDALRATEFPQARFAAERIAETNDRIDTAIPIVIGLIILFSVLYVVTASGDDEVDITKTPQENVLSPEEDQENPDQITESSTRREEPEVDETGKPEGVSSLDWAVFVE